MTQASKEYALALFQLALENEDGPRYLSDLETVGTYFNQEPQYLLFLHSPGIPKSERIEALEKAFGAYVSPTVLSFLKLLCDAGRINLFEDCRRAYIALWEEKERTQNVTVTSAVPLTEAEKAKLKAKLEQTSGQHIFIIYRLDASLLGGMKIEFSDRVIDGTLTRRLHELKEAIQ